MSTISENDANLVKNIDDAVNTGKDPAKPSVVNPSDESSDFPEKKKISPITNKDSANRCPRNILVIVSSIGLIFYRKRGVLFHQVATYVSTIV